jgi:hypothetical protein
MSVEGNVALPLGPNRLPGLCGAGCSGSRLSAAKRWRDSASLDRLTPVRRNRRKRMKPTIALISPAHAIVRNSLSSITPVICWPMRFSRTCCQGDESKAETAIAAEGFEHDKAPASTIRSLWRYDAGACRASLCANRRRLAMRPLCRPDIGGVGDPFAVRCFSFEVAVEHVGGTAVACCSLASGRRRCRCRARGACSRIKRAIRSSPHDAPSAN